VWPWLSKAMANTTRDGTDGTDQFFGIPSASQDWAVKQGWMTGLVLLSGWGRSCRQS